MNLEKFVIDTNFQTPNPVCDYMASLIPIDSLDVLEPTPGIGNLKKAIQKRGFKVVVPHADYFECRERLISNTYDAVCFNPPFSSKSAFMKNAPKEFKDARGMKFGYKLLLEVMDLSDNVIALMPWFTISDSDVRLRFLYDYGLKSVTALPRKTFQYARIQTVVIELQKGYSGKTEFKVFDRLINKTKP
jgi:type I restriction-modification system DNA methylase subunit